MLHIRLFVILVILIIGYGCHEHQTTVKSSPQADSLTNQLKAFAQSSPIPGFAVGVVNEEGLLYEAAFGWADQEKKIPFTPETIHAVASVSKTFLAVSVLKLVEEGKLKLDEPINDILPFPIINPHFPNTPIRVKHLLNHTSSIIDDAFIPYYIGEADISLLNDSKSFDSLPKHLLLDVQYYRMGKKISLEQYIRNYTQKGARWYTDSTFLNKEPGTSFEYSNLAASIAALVVEIKSGQSFRDYSRHVIFEPLHLTHTAWDYDSLPRNSYSKLYAQEDPATDSTVREFPFHYMMSYPASEMKTNIPDLATFLSEMIRGYNGNGKLLSKEMYKQLFQPVTGIAGFDTKDSSRFNSHFSIASFWSVAATGHRMHFGGRTGTYAFIYFNPKTNRGGIAYANLRHDSFGKILEMVGKMEEVVR
ncbi:MAG: beta-lactamase family protein [Chitinophagaceae bacterium]|nr:beta-lactamase family protein [Chitinophagaceae bacterium]